MKKVTLFLIASFLLAGVPSLFAQEGPDHNNGEMSGPPSMMGPGPMGQEFRLGTVITAEYKKVSGIISFSQRILPTIKIEGQDYILEIQGIDKKILISLKDGDTVTFEGFLTIIKSPEAKDIKTFHPFKVEIDGKIIDLMQPQEMHHSMKAPNGPDMKDEKPDTHF